MKDLSERALLHSSSEAPPRSARTCWCPLSIPFVEEGIMQNSIQLGLVTVRTAT